MRPDETTPGLSSGVKAEVRVAQAWFWDGYYVRRGIDLQHRFGTEISTVTDLDILGFAFDPSLRARKAIGEVKTGKSSATPKPLDRALWLRGLRELVGAEAGEITTAFKTSTAVRDACRSLGVSVQHLDDLAVREARLDIALLEDCGSQGETIAKHVDEVRRTVKNDVPRERAYWFLASEVWFLEPFDALKRTLGLVREMSKTWPPEANVAATRAARWFLAEAISIATLNLAVIAGWSNTMDRATFLETARARLASGDIPYHSMSKLADRIDEYVGRLLARVDAPPELRATAMGAFQPTAPEYAQPLLELIERLAADAQTTAKIARQIDTVLFERLVRRRQLSGHLTSRLRLDAAGESQIRLIAAFLRGQVGIPAAVDNALTAPFAGTADTANDRAGAGPALFDWSPKV